MRSLVLALLVATTPAHAALPGSPFELAVTLGVGMGSGPLSWGSAANPGFPDAPRAVSADTSLGGLAIDLAVSGAMGVTPKVALGLAIDATRIGDEVRSAHLPRAGYDSALLLGVGACAIFHPTRGGWVYRLGAGVAMGTFAGGGESIKSYDNVVTFDAVFGPSFEVSAGRRLGPTATLALRLRAAALANEHVTYVPVILSLRVGFGGI